MYDRLLILYDTEIKKLLERESYKLTSTGQKNLQLLYKNRDRIREEAAKTPASGGMGGVRL